MLVYLLFIHSPYLLWWFYCAFVVCFFSLLFQLQLKLTVIADDDDDDSRTLGPLCYTHSFSPGMDRQDKNSWIVWWKRNTPLVRSVWGAYNLNADRHYHYLLVGLLVRIHKLSVQRDTSLPFVFLLYCCNSAGWNLFFTSETIDSYM